MAWESLNVAGESEAHARWEAAGRPILPSLSVDGAVEPVLHVSQVAEALGLDWSTPLASSALVSDTLALLAAWGCGLAPLDLAALLAPTPSRGRSLRNLTVNVHHPFELLPEAWRSGVFPWDPDADGEREECLADAEAVRSYAAAAHAGWDAFVESVGSELDEADPQVVTPRGTARFSVVLDTQRSHAAFHLRQLEHVTGAAVTPELDDLILPAEVY